MTATLPDQQLLEVLASYIPVDRLGAKLRIWGWNSPVHDAFGDEADDVVVTVLPYFRPTPVWRSLAGLPKLRLLQAQLAGYDNLLHTIPDNITLVNARRVHEASTSKLVVGLMFTAQRELPRWVRECRRQAVFTRALTDSRVLMVGVGAIGETIRSRLAPFEVGITRVATTARDDEYGHIHGIDELSELLPNTDILVLIVPPTDSTHGLIDAEGLVLLPDGALMMSVARGPVADTDVITAEMVAGRLRMASDVFDPEPSPGDHPLWQADGAFISLHIGDNTTVMLPRIVASLTNQPSRLADGRRLKFVVKS